MGGEPVKALDAPVNVDRDDGRDVLGRRRALYLVTSTALVLLVVLAVVDGAGLLAVYGVDTAHTTAGGGGYELDVRYATVSRPALATPFEITVTRPGGFDGPVTVAVSLDYLAMWDENGLDPQPTSETSTADFLLWTFEPPGQGDSLTVSYDARIEPAAQNGQSGTVALLDERANPLTSVSFRTRVLP